VFDTAVLAVQYALSGEGIALIDTYLFGDYISAAGAWSALRQQPRRRLWLLFDHASRSLERHRDRLVPLLAHRAVRQPSRPAASTICTWRFRMSDRASMRDTVPSRCHNEHNSMKHQPRKSGGDRRRRGRRQRLYHSDEGRLERRAVDRAGGIDLGLDLARRRRHAHGQRRSERRETAAIHHQLYKEIERYPGNPAECTSRAASCSPERASASTG
jgi:hypothetical protein